MSVDPVIAALQRVHVFVVGDLMLDSYIKGVVHRISPEAPVPVLLESQQWSVLGGAGNVAANVANFGAKVTLAGQLGQDQDGEHFLGLCRKAAIDTRGVISSRKKSTIRKLRVMAGYQQIVRIDHEQIADITSEEAEQIVDCFQHFVKGQGLKVFVVSDYGKGLVTSSLLTKLIGIANKSEIKVIADPKSIDLKRYKGSYIIKPNLSEGRQMLRVQRPDFIKESFEQEIEAVSKAVLSGSESRNVVLSLSDKGVAARGADTEDPIWFSSSAVKVADVSGAGDTMISFLALAAGAGFDLKKSVALANIAAGIVCSKLGTSLVDVEEFSEAYSGSLTVSTTSKIAQAAELSRLLGFRRKAGERIVFTNGCFDLLHAGHIAVLQKARSFGDLLVVGINSDASVKRLKGPNRPIQNESDRAQILSALACVDFVVVFDQETPIELIRACEPDVLVKGGDWSPSTIVGADDVQKRGGRVEVVPLVPGRSTTAIVEKSKSK